MGSNSERMTFEEKIVQKIKESTMGSFIEDEDSITELAKRAVQEALMKQRTDTSGWHSKTYDSPVMTAAKEAAQKATTLVVEEFAKQLFEEPAFKRAINEYIAASFPTILSGVLQAMVVGHQQNTINEATIKIGEMIRNRSIL